MRNLIIHWYNGNDMSLTDKMHIIMIKNYAKIFNGLITIFISDDNGDSNNTIVKKQYEKIFNFFPTQPKIEVIKNDKINRESITFSIFLKTILKDDNNITFFMHNKGNTNKQTISVLMWCVGMYYFNLEHINEIEKELVDNKKVFAGTYFKRYNFGAFNRYKWHFSGTFFWINNSELISFFKKHGDFGFPIGRYSVEKYPGNVPDDLAVTYGMKKPTIIKDYSLYDLCLLYLKTYCDEDKLTSFINFFNTKIPRKIIDTSKKVIDPFIRDWNKH